MGCPPNASCTTNRKPYHLAVAAVLLRTALLVPEAFAVASSASWDGEWANGSPWWPAAAIRYSARRVVADLFDTHPTASPLRETIRDVRFVAPRPVDLRDDESDPTTAAGSDHLGGQT